MEIVYTILMTLNLTCAFLILIAGIHRKKVHFISLALMNIVMFFFHYYSLQFHNATILSDAIALSKIHTSLVIIALPLMTFTFGKWSKYKYINHLSIFFSAMALILLIINISTNYSIRYGELAELVHYKSILDGDLITLKGDPELTYIILKLLFIFNSCLIMVFASKLYKQQEKVLTTFLIMLCILQIFSSYMGYKFDNLEWPIFYLGGVSFTLLSLLCTTLISFSYKEKAIQLIKQQGQQKELEDAITKLAHGLSSIDSSKFYAELVTMIFDFTKAKVILIGLTTSPENTHIQSQALLKEGVLINNLSYSIKGFPCEVAINNKEIFYSNSVLSTFPGRKILNDEPIETYLGLPLLDKDNFPIGIIHIGYKKPTKINTSLIDGLKIFASRVESEIKREELAKRLKRMAYYDYQSQLPNREKLLEILNQKYFSCKKNKKNALFMLIDLDHFGDINRQFGHEVGDQVIKQIGLRLQHYSSASIFIARNSGDQFAFILSEATRETSSLINVHWQAIKGIINTPYFIGQRKIKLSCSMGAVLFPQQIDNRFDIVTSAEHSIQRAKESGRNHYYLFEPELLAKVDRAKELESDLAKAIDAKGQLNVVYQAKVKSCGQVIGSEALLRWSHPDKGFISPVEFIPVAEESGLIHSLGKWVVNEVCQQIKEWQNNGQIVHKVSINVAASQFDDPSFIHFVFSTLEKYQLTPEIIEVELTESGLLTNIEAAIENLSQLRKHGITIALDDFGTGFSSLAYLQDLPLDVLKIDKSFVDNIFQTKSAELIRSIISISHHMKFKTVAEGTETLDQVNILAEMGCNYFQGYYFSKPLSSENFIHFCKNNEK